MKIIDNLIDFDEYYTKRILTSGLTTNSKKKEFNDLERRELGPHKLMHMCSIQQLETLTTLKFKPDNFNVHIDNKSINEIIELLPYLKNVKKIEFCDIDKDKIIEILSLVEEEYPDFFNQIKRVNIDNVTGLKILSLPEMPNLIELTVADNISLENINMFKSTAKNIQFLSIIHNPNLKIMPKLSVFENLTALDFYGNEKFELNQNKYLDLIANICIYPERIYSLDFNYYKDFYKYFSKPEHQKDGENFFYNSNWNEMVFPNNKQRKIMESKGKTWRQVPITYNSNEMRSFHERCLKIVNTYVMSEDTDIEKLAAVSRWMWQNVTYDDEALETPNRMHSIETTLQKENGTTQSLRILQGKSQGTNGSVNAILYGSCVCQGYTRTVKYLGSLVGIRMYDIHCDVIHEEVKPGENKDPKKSYKKIPKADGTIGEFRIEPHSMTQGFITENEKQYQFFMDNTWDAGFFQQNHTAPYFLVDKKIFANKRIFSQDTLKNNGVIESIFPTFIIDSTKKKELFRMMDQRFEEIKNKGEEITPRKK